MRVGSHRHALGLQLDERAWQYSTNSVDRGSADSAGRALSTAATAISASSTVVDDDLESQIEDLQNFLEAQKKDATVAKLQEEVDEAYGIEHSGDYLALYAETGELIYRSAFLQAHQSQVLLPDQIKQRMFKNREIDGRPFRFVFQKLNVNGHVFTVETGITTEDAVETLRLFRSYLLMFAPLLLLVAAGVGFWLSRRALAPVDALVRTAREVSGANLSSRLQKLETGDQLQRLADTLNEMLDRIETAFLRITQFTAVLHMNSGRRYP